MSQVLHRVVGMVEIEHQPDPANLRSAHGDLPYRVLARR
jgi:hypothetical protein